MFCKNPDRYQRYVTLGLHMHKDNLKILKKYREMSEMTEIKYLKILKTKKSLFSTQAQLNYIISRR